MFKYDFKITKFGPSHQKVISLVPNGSRVLEFGCATGYMTKELSKNRRCEVTAVEIDSSALKKAAPFAKIAIQADLNNEADLKQIKGTFDRILFADVLEHLVHPDKVLMQVRKFLKPGGQIVISLPNIAFWEIRRDLAKGKFEYTDLGIMDKTHLHFYTEKELASLANNSGMRITQLHYIPAHFPMDKLFRWKTRAIKRPFNKLVHKTFPRLFAYQFVAVFEPR